MERTEEDSNRADVQVADDDGPGHLYEIFSQNELVAERMKLLNYEREFLSIPGSLRALSRHYFVRSTNVGEQFHLFTSISAWLIRKLAIIDMEMPHEFDDPNAIIAKILNALKIKEIDVGFTPNKLKSGSGQQCIFVLLHLSRLALEQDGFAFGEMRMSENEPIATNDDEIKLDQAELTTEQFEEEVELADDLDEPSAELADKLLEHETEMGRVYDVEIGDKLKDIMPSNIRHIELMEEELKRVTPQLKVTIRANLKNWRMHAEQMQKIETLLNEQYSEMKPFLLRTSDEISKAMERIQAREQHLNNQFASLLQQYRNKQNELAIVSEQYKESSGTMNNRTATLNSLNEEIDQIKQQIEEQGAQNTSGAPILKIKQALSKMDKDCFVARVQIATLEQVLLQTQLADRLNDHAMDYLNY